MRVLSDEERARRSASNRAAWARRREAGTDKQNYSLDERKRRSERLKAMLANNPEIAAKRLANARDALNRVKQTTAYRETMSVSVKKAHTVPAYKQLMSKISKARWADPEFARKISEWAKTNTKALKVLHSPAAKKKQKVAAKLCYDEKRGFSIPHAMHDDYLMLTKKKKMKPAEAGKLLGLI